MDNKFIKRFDQIRLLTTRNVKWMSAPKGAIVSPKGVWSVAAIINNSDILCVQNTAAIRIPMTDVLKVADYDISSITKDFGKLSYGEREEAEGGGSERSEGLDGGDQPEIC